MSTAAERWLARLSCASHEIELTRDSGIGPALQCPRCGSDHLHHSRATVFDRGEDDNTVSVTTVVDGLTATHLLADAECGNPSARRDGGVIAFDCESCGDAIELTFAQHKGCPISHGASRRRAWRAVLSGISANPLVGV